MVGEAIDEGVGKKGIKRTKELSSSICLGRGRKDTWPRSEPKGHEHKRTTCCSKNGAIKKSRDSQRLRAKLVDTRESTKKTKFNYKLNDFNATIIRAFLYIYILLFLPIIQQVLVSLLFSNNVIQKH